MSSDAENFKERIKNGDVKAFELLFQSHYTRLTLFANRFLNDLDVSEEIVSDVPVTKLPSKTDPVGTWPKS
jgi:DNA-directed RNA polymerase specialized sigma24 family protein